MGATPRRDCFGHSLTLMKFIKAEQVHKTLTYPALIAALDRYHREDTQVMDDMLLAQPVDAVIIASSTSAHADQLIRSAKAGKAVICEKPIHNETKTAWEAVRVALGAGVPNAF